MALRDPIHEWIRFSDAEKELINTPLVQRLRWVGQLTIVSMIYQGGTHSRFEHSMGVMYLAGKYIKRLLKTTDDPEFLEKRKWIIQLARVAGLLHDIGHGPFSHSFDYAVYSKIYNSENGHDIHRHYIIHNDPAIQKALQNLGIDPDDVSSVWGYKGFENINSTTVKKPDMKKETAVHKLIRAILQGPLGADRMDFTLRDSYYTGTQHFGSISITRIMDNSKIHNKKLVYKGKVLNDIVNALHGREHMYASVYLHKTCMAGSLLVESYLQTMITELDLIERTRDLEKFVFLHDHILSEARVKGLAGQNVSEKIITRKFPKLVHEFQILEHQDPPQLDLSNKTLVKSRLIAGLDASGFDKHNIMFEFEFEESVRYLNFSMALNKQGYSVETPYYFVRVYEH